MVRTKSFLDELSGPFVAPPDLEPGSVTIRNELPKLLRLAIERLAIERLDRNKLDRLIDFSFRMNKRELRKKYRINHPEEFKRWGYTPTGKQLRLLRFAARLLKAD